MLGLKFIFHDFFEHGIIAVGQVAVVFDPGELLFMIADVLPCVNLESVSDCVSSHLLKLLFNFLNLNDFVLAQGSREAGATASAGKAAQRTKLTALGLG